MALGGVFYRSNFCTEEKRFNSVVVTFPISIRFWDGTGRILKVIGSV